MEYLSESKRRHYNNLVEDYVRRHPNNVGKIRDSFGSKHFHKDKSNRFKLDYELKKRKEKPEAE